MIEKNEKNEKKMKYQNPYYIYPPDNQSDLPTKNRPVLLSDEFAKAAMQGMMVSYGPNDDYALKDIARISYEVADEMIKARHEYMRMTKTRSKENN